MVRRLVAPEKLTGMLGVWRALTCPPPDAVRAARRAAGHRHAGLARAWWWVLAAVSLVLAVAVAFGVAGAAGAGQCSLAAGRNGCAARSPRASPG